MKPGNSENHLKTNPGWIISSAGINAFTDYYPFGFAMPGRQYITGSPYRFGYQGQFAEKDEETGLNHFEARSYDSRIGRWLTTDPANQDWSYYMSMGNNPVSNFDPDGREWFTSWFGLGSPRWFQPGDFPRNQIFWQMNPGNGFLYNMGTIKNPNWVVMMIGEVEITGNHIAIKADNTYNEHHPGVKQMLKEERWYAKHAWEGQENFKKKGLPTMNAVATVITLGGLGFAGALNTFFSYAVPATSAANSINDAAGNPLGIPETVSIIINVGGVIYSGKNIYDIALQIPNIITGVASVSVNIHFNNVNLPINNLP